MLRLLTALVACTVICSAAARAADDLPSKQPANLEPWQPGSPFKFGKKEKKEDKFRQSLSGVACPATSARPRVCLAVFDEGPEARYLLLDERSYRADDERVVLRPGDGELDGEAAATDGAFYYVTGSHSAKRNSCESNPDSRFVIRFRIDPATGRAARVNGALADYQATGRLWEVMAAHPQLAAFVGEKMCLGTEPPEKAPQLEGRNGVNIEGMTIRDKRLFFGFRGPVKGGVAKILSVAPDALFAGGDASPQVFDVEVGEGRGIRDLLAVSDGILVLAGPDDDDGDVGWIVLRWDPASPGQAKKLAHLDLTGVKKRPCDETVKPEALLVLEDAPPQAYRVLVLSDGLCDGGPLEFALPR